MQREGVERNDAEQWCTYLHLRCNTGNEFGFEVGDESKAFGGAKPWEQAGIPFVLAHMEDLIAVSILMETRQGHCCLVHELPSLSEGLAVPGMPSHGEVP